MSTEVICPDCDTVLERHDDDEPYREVLERCDRCERERVEAEYEAARDDLDEAFGRPSW